MCRTREKFAFKSSHARLVGSKSSLLLAFSHEPQGETRERGKRFASELTQLPDSESVHRSRVQERRIHLSAASRTGWDTFGLSFLYVD